KVLLTQRVQSLPDGPLCFNLTQQTMPAGQRVPAQGYRADPLGVAFMLTGQARLDYAGGPSMTVGTGEGMFIGADNWYAVTNTGTAPDTAIVYSLSCQPAPAGIPGVTQLGNSGPLAGVRSGTPYDLVFVEVKGVPGSVIAAHT
ncbi:MAG: hypothetical protein NTZ05_03595, partial [Chloroflexi bacterium]|nr:hypothetical protein [Chloroflexota bacterium]